MISIILAVVTRRSTKRRGLSIGAKAEKLSLASGMSSDNDSFYSVPSSLVDLTTEANTM